MAAKKITTPAPKNTARNAKPTASDPAPRNNKKGRPADAAPVQSPAPAPQTATKAKAAPKPARQPRTTSRDAAYEVLQSAKKPLSGEEIVTAMTRLGLFTGKNGETAVVNIQYRLRTDSKNRFTRTDDGRWTVKA